MEMDALVEAKDLYNILHWGAGYFDINDEGNVCAYPNGHATAKGIDLYQLTQKLQEQGFSLPILVRFNDVLKNRLRDLQQAFTTAITQFEYEGQYTSVYPIKVNQQRSVVRQIINSGCERVGLEVGSKSELIAVLAFSPKRNSVVICNGYKDKEYIRLALIGQQLGHDVFIILEKLSELNIVLKQSNELGVIPNLGLRVRLATKGKGQWQDTGGEKSKFGLSPNQILLVIEQLRQIDKLNLLRLLHFHIGSQIANITDIQKGLGEVARYFSELVSMGVPIDTIDVGGGLGVDYAGTHSREAGSMNYSLQEYANNIIYTLLNICDEHQIPHPNIITESGRAMTAHHAVLITNVIGVERTVPTQEITPITDDDHIVLYQLWETWQSVSPRTALEDYHDACFWFQEGHGLFIHGMLDLKDWARVEKFYFAICGKVRDNLRPGVRSHRAILDELNDKLADKFFVNFSLFQSLPDAWAIDQVFPIMPLHGLNQPLTQRAVIQDITCDSDGRVDKYVDNEGLETSLALLPYDPNKPYYLGIFLVGAYQEILGDMHNLFGDTHSINVITNEQGGYELVDSMHGDTVADMLKYVRFDPEEILKSYRKQFDNAHLSEELRQQFEQDIVAGLSGYTYLED